MTDRPPEPLLPRLLRRLPYFEGNPAVGVVTGVAIALVALGVRWGLDDHLPPGFPYVTFFPAVVASSLFFGTWSGVACAAVGFVCARWFFIAPEHSMSLVGAPGWAMGLYAFVTVVNVVSIHLLQASFRGLDAERRRSRDLAESRGLLFHELQHRVGNNLQMVGSLLALQARQVESGPAQLAVQEAARRVQLVGQVQRTLYDPEGSRRGLAEMLGPLVRDVVASGHGTSVGVQLVTEADFVLSAEQAIPMALIVTEAVSNALEHGFGVEGGGTIRVIVSRIDEAGSKAQPWLSVAVEDNGTGLPDGFDLAASDSLGLRIARSLATGLGGTFTLSPAAGGGTLADLRVPLHEGEERQFRQVSGGSQAAVSVARGREATA